jgi:hypothetical protein
MITTSPGDYSIPAEDLANALQKQVSQDIQILMIFRVKLFESSFA